MDLYVPIYGHGIHKDGIDARVFTHLVMPLLTFGYEDPLQPDGFFTQPRSWKDGDFTYIQCIFRGELGQQIQGGFPYYDCDLIRSQSFTLKGFRSIGLFSDHYLSVDDEAYTSGISMSAVNKSLEA